MFRKNFDQQFKIKRVVIQFGNDIKERQESKYLHIQAHDAAICCQLNKVELHKQLNSRQDCNDSQCRPLRNYFKFEMNPQNDFQENNPLDLSSLNQTNKSIDFKRTKQSKQQLSDINKRKLAFLQEIAVQRIDPILKFKNKFKTIQKLKEKQFKATSQNKIYNFFEKDNQDLRSKKESFTLDNNRKQQKTPELKRKNESNFNNVFLEKKQKNANNFSIKVSEMVDSKNYKTTQDPCMIQTKIRKKNTFNRPRKITPEDDSLTLKQSISQNQVLSLSMELNIKKIQHNNLPRFSNNYRFLSRSNVVKMVEPYQENDQPHNHLRLSPVSNTRNHSVFQDKHFSSLQQIRLFLYIEYQINNLEANDKINKQAQKDQILNQSYTLSQQAQDQFLYSSDIELIII